MEKFITKDEITKRVTQLAVEITQDYKKTASSLPPVMICILNGSIHFFSDLTRAMGVTSEIDFIRLKSYDGQDNSGGIMCLKELELDLRGKYVYLVDDICDTGTTILEALFMINSRQPAEVKVITLFKRKNGVDLTDFCGFDIDDQWVIGYGLDNNGIQRELPDIYKLN
jgi:hypoxanthine phosphoribosyltransferase